MVGFTACFAQGLALFLFDFQFSLEVGGKREKAWAWHDFRGPNAETDTCLFEPTSPFFFTGF